MEGIYERLIKKEDYQNKFVILWGCRLAAQTILKLFQLVHIEIDIFCDNDPNKWGKEFQGKNIVSPQELMERIEEEKMNGRNPLVQMALYPENQPIVKKQLENMGIFDIIYTEDARSGLTVEYIQKLQNMEFSEKEKFEKRMELLHHNVAFLPQKEAFDEIAQKEELPFIVCQVGKTGDNTIERTLQASNVPVSVLWHKPSSVVKETVQQENKTFKFITAVREPISRDLSHVTHAISQGTFFVMYPELLNNPDFLKDSSNLNQIYHSFTEKMLPIKYQYPFTFRDGEQNSFIECFFQEFSEHIIDIRKEKFDTKKGFSIVKEGNVEVFVYQLEKLNHLQKELSDWVGVPITEIASGNKTSIKSIASTYELLKKNVTFSRDYFQACYNDSYVKHCYSPEDIEKFKKKWETRIIPD